MDPKNSKNSVVSGLMHAILDKIPDVPCCICDSFVFPLSVITFIVKIV